MLVNRAAEGRMYDCAITIPVHKVGLVPGCSRRLSNGRPNLYFRTRIEAAATLFKEGRIDYILVSGDNRTIYYNEPGDMRAALIALGIPPERIVCDYAGLSTFDSVVRARDVFGQASFTIISQPFQNRRALYIAASRGIDAVAYNAEDVQGMDGLRTMAREQLALIWAVAGENLVKREPHFSSQPKPIGDATSAPTPPDAASTARSR
jgi:SanA protein